MDAAFVSRTDATGAEQAVRRSQRVSVHRSQCILELVSLRLALAPFGQRLQTALGSDARTVPA